LVTIGGRYGICGRFLRMGSFQSLESKELPKFYIFGKISILKRVGAC